MKVTEPTAQIHQPKVKMVKAQPLTTRILRSFSVSGRFVILIFLSCRYFVRA